jgi:ubiquinone/menaquinone biosynthesis C-methylase UbiE
MARTALGATNDFSPIAARYDATRFIPMAVLGTCYDRLIRAGALPPAGTLLDAGCGTGQISLPLAARGYAICGVDVSADMLAIARSKGPMACFAVADVRALPARDGAFDAVVASKLFMHVGDWQNACRELLRVLQPGACLVHVADRGAFGNAVRKQFSAHADAIGFGDRYLGVRDLAPVAEFLVAQGCEMMPVEAADLRWERRIRHGDMLDQLGERLFAEFWHLPTAVYAGILADTARWVDAQPSGRDTVETLAPWLSVEAFRKRR